MATKVKRKLTEQEIADICSSIQTSLPSTFVVDGIREQIKRQLEHILIYPIQIPKLKEAIARQYESSLITPGEMVGCIASTSIGETTTQASLNSFHSTGQLKAGLTTGVARLTELLNASKNMKTPSVTLYFDNKYIDNTSLDEVRKFCHSKIQQVFMYDLIKNFTINERPEKEWWYDVYAKLFNDSFDGCDFRLRLELDPQKIWLHNIDMLKCIRLINEECNVSDCLAFVISPPHLGFIDIWCDTDSIPEIDNILGDKKITDEERQKVKDYVEQNKGVHYLKRCVLPALKTILVSGIEGIEKCYYTQKDNSWIVDTKGGSMKQTARLVEIDLVKSHSNNMWEILECLGVEATVQFLLKEFGKQLNVGRRHLDVMIDWMTNGGGIDSVNRYGMDIHKVGPFAKASFEQPLDAFFEAAHNAQTDDLMGVSASVATGRLAKLGTGVFELFLDTEKIIKNSEILDTTSRSVEVSATDDIGGDEVLEVIEEYYSDVDDEEMDMI